MIIDTFPYLFRYIAYSNFLAVLQLLLFGGLIYMLLERSFTVAASSPWEMPDGWRSPTRRWKS